MTECQREWYRASRRIERERFGVATDSGLARLEGNHWRKSERDWNFPGGWTHTIFVDRQGTLWVSTEDTLVFLPLRRESISTDRYSSRPGNTNRAGTKRKIVDGRKRRDLSGPSLSSDNRQPADEIEVQVGSVGNLLIMTGALVDHQRWCDGPPPFSGSRTVERQDYGTAGTAVDSFTTKDGFKRRRCPAVLQDRDGTSGSEPTTAWTWLQNESGSGCSPLQAEAFPSWLPARRETSGWKMCGSSSGFMRDAPDQGGDSILAELYLRSVIDPA